MLVRAPVLYLEDNMTSTQKEIFVGIDVSKTTMDVAFWDSEIFWQLPNDGEGWKRTGQAIATTLLSLVVIEASGGLEQPVVASYIQRNCQWQLSIPPGFATLPVRPAS